MPTTASIGSSRNHIASRNKVTSAGPPTAARPSALRKGVPDRQVKAKIGTATAVEALAQPIRGPNRPIGSRKIAHTEATTNTGSSTRMVTMLRASGLTERQARRRPDQA